MNERRLDISSEPNLSKSPEKETTTRPFLGIRFTCCSVYARIYRNHAKTAYCGNCPKCSRPVTVKITPNGTDSRFFSS